MADAVSEAQNIIRSAIASIDAEVRSLNAALDSLTVGSSSKRHPRSSGRRPAARRASKGTRKAAKGARRLEVIAAISKKPGITGARLAKELGIPASQVYDICGSLVKEKTVRKRGVTYEMLPGAKV
jgi:hypothetical protein